MEDAVEPSFFLARFWGLLLIVIPFCYLVRKDSLNKLVHALAQESALLIFVIAGYIAIIVGLTTIILHNSWYPNLGLVVTLLGWGSLLCGAIHVMFADKFYLLARRVERRMFALRITLVISLVLGVLLTLPVTTL